VATIPEVLAAALKHHQAGQLSKAEQLYRQILGADPRHPDALHLLGVLANQRGRHLAAVELIGQAIAVNPFVPAYHNNLGMAWRASGKLAEARACYEQALWQRPDYADAFLNLGLVLKEQGKLDEAIAHYRQAIRLRPDLSEAHNSLGVALKEAGKFDEAIACYRRALELRPDYADAHFNLGNALRELGRPEEAIACYRSALRFKPGHALAHCNLGLVLSQQEQLAEAAAHYRQALELQPDLVEGHVNLGAVLSRQGSFQEAAAYYRRAIQLKPNMAEAYCSLGNILRYLGRLAEAVANQIRSDEIDILFELSGHTFGNRLLVFARKPAPIQVSWIGYEGTTGLRSIDYLLADRYVIPAGAEGDYPERILRLPDSYASYEPPADAPQVGPLPASGRGFVTFGSFNNPAKITSEVVDVWAAILRQVSQARLVLKYLGMDDAGAGRRLLDLFCKQGVSADRLELRGMSSFAGALAEYNEVDVALDPFPFSGGATTCNALWMGVPVITCPGPTFASRHGLSYLSSLGMTETIAGDPGEYVRLAVTLAGDCQRLSALRAALRPRMAASPLCDGKRHAASLQNVLRGVWRDYCAR
jgi:predicted O-linked N-acetylglucosamine transferase (SPINDLY family)